MSSNLGRELFIALTIAIGGLMYMLLTHTIRERRPWQGVAAMLIASPVVIASTWLLVQRARPSASTFTLASISYAATFADLFVLTMVAYMTTRLWCYYWFSVPRVFRTRKWWLGSYCFGLLVGAYFHFVLGGPADSNSPVLSERLHDSATSWMHNLGVMPAIAGALFCTLAPLFFTNGARRQAWFVFALLVFGWGGMVVWDMLRGGFNPHWLDVEMAWKYLRPA